MFALVFQSSAKIMIRGKGSIKEGKIHNVRCDVPFFFHILAWFVFLYPRVFISMYCKHQQISHTCRQVQPRVCQLTFWRKILDRNQKKSQLKLYESCIILVASLNIHLHKPTDNENRKYFDSLALTLVVIVWTSYLLT